MATVTKTIKASGGDYTTVAAWEAATNLNSGADIWKGVISDNTNFNENVTINVNGTNRTSSYVWLTVASANRHAGIASTGHGRMYGTGSTHILTISSDFCRVDWLDIKQDQAGASDEGIRITASTDDVLIDYCIIWTDAATADQDGVYTGNYSVANLRVSNTIFYGWLRAGIHIQQFNATAQAVTLDVDHCSFYDNGIGGSEVESGAIYVRSEAALDSITIGLFNTWGAETTTNAPFVDGSAGTQPDSPDGTVTWNGSDNGRDDTTDHIQGTDNTTAWEDATDGIVAVTKSTGSWIVVTNLTGGSEDFTLLDDAAGNIMAGRGINRQGSEPDARQDFSTAIDGTRPTTGVDIGASQVTSGAGDQTLTPGLAQQLVTDFAPAITTGPVSILPGLQQQLTQAFDPAVTTQVFLSPALAQQLSQAFDPAITTGPVTLSPALVQELINAFDPVVTTEVTLSPGLQQQLAQAFDPSVSTGPVTLSPGLVQQLVSAFDPAITVGSVVITPALAQQLVTAFDPVISAVYFISPTLVQQLVLSFDPTVSPGDVSILPALIQELVNAFDPTLTTVVTISPELANQPVVAYDPVVSFPDSQVISPELAQQITVSYDPAVSPGAVTITVGLVQQLAQAYGLVVSGDDQPDDLLLMTDWSN